MTETVYMLGGAFSVTNYMPTMLQGAITNGNTQIQVPYNNFGIFLSNLQQGAAMLDAFLTAGTGPRVVFGHSLGAIVGCYWLNNYVTGPISTTTISPGDLSFVFIGNSVSVYGGALGPESGAPLQNWFGPNIAAPSATPFQVADIRRQYDGWADYPTGATNLDAEFNTLAGQTLIHPNYQGVNPNPAAPGNVAITEGNITYIWSMTEPAPMFGTAWNSVVAGLDAATRPTIESAYDRPVTVPTPTY
jgi:hypothetical protein